MLTSIIRTKFVAASASRTSPACTLVFEITQGRFVAVVAVGDEYRFRPHQAGDAC